MLGCSFKEFVKLENKHKTLGKEYVDYIFCIEYVCKVSKFDFFYFLEIEKRLNSYNFCIEDKNYVYDTAIKLLTEHKRKDSFVEHSIKMLNVLKQRNI